MELLSGIVKGKIIMNSWKCVECGQVWAPWKDRCDNCIGVLPKIAPYKPYIEPHRTDPWPFVPWNPCPIIWYGTTTTAGNTIF